MNAHSVAKLYFIKDDTANVRELSVLILFQEIVALNFFATLLCDKIEYFPFFFIRQLEVLIRLVKDVPCRPNRVIAKVNNVIRTFAAIVAWGRFKPDRLNSCDLTVIVGSFAKAQEPIRDYLMISKPGQKV
jgi:hypothetical protein